MASKIPDGSTRTEKVVLVLTLPEMRALRVAVEHTTMGSDEELARVFGTHHNQVKAARRMRGKVLPFIGGTEEDK